MPSSMMYVTIAITTTIAAAADRPAELERRVAEDLRRPAAAAGPEPEELVEENAPDQPDHREADVEHDLVERVDVDCAFLVGPASGVSASAPARRRGPRRAASARRSRAGQRDKAAAAAAVALDRVP